MIIFLLYSFFLTSLSSSSSSYSLCLGSVPGCDGVCCGSGETPTTLTAFHLADAWRTNNISCWPLNCSNRFSSLHNTFHFIDQQHYRKLITRRSQCLLYLWEESSDLVGSSLTSSSLHSLVSSSEWTLMTSLITCRVITVMQDNQFVS